MRTGLKKYEKTTEITFDEGSPIIVVRTHNTSLKKRLVSFSEKYPTYCQITDDDVELGFMSFEIEKGRLSFHMTPPHSQTRREASRRWAKEHGVHKK